ncbi:hypothetical protein [Novosphingobium resinovorum]|uniref:hypothetical protein n=1 Tax=Novosphingobium resinovorum TaxID=158500 RepID=UPI002ED0EDDB|nr:hypothetical protein [Novosphingobium resinovorum]
MTSSLLRSLLVLAPCLGAFGLAAACSGEKEPGPVAVGLEHIDCAVGGVTKLTPACSVERIEKDGRTTLVVHHPDGGYRRFAATGDGTGVTTLDSAGPVRSRLVDKRLEVTVGLDRYVFPATVKPHAAHD